MLPFVCWPLSPPLTSLSPLKPVSSVRATCYQVSVCEKEKGTEAQPAGLRAWDPSRTDITGTHLQDHSDSAGGLTKYSHAQGAAILEPSCSLYVVVTF